MIAATDKFRKALPYSHQVLTRVIVMQPDSANGYVDTDVLTVADGSLSLDGGRNIIRQGNLTLAPASVYQSSPLQKITEASRLRLERGIKFMDGSEEWIVMAVLTVQSSTSHLGQATISVSGYDPSSCIDDYDLMKEYVPTGTVVDEIKYLVDEALWETAVWTVDPGIDLTVKTADGTVLSGSRWTALNTLATSVGAQVQCDNLGKWRLRKIDTDFVNVVDRVASGANGVLIGGNSGKNRQNLFNAAVVRWDDPEGGGTVIETDNDPNSPTYWLGPFGKRPSPSKNLRTITTQDQATKAAIALLSENKGFQASVDFQTLHNPLLEPGDVLEIEISGVLHQIHVIDSISYSMNSGSMSCKTRAVREVYT